jgi:amidase
MSAARGPRMNPSSTDLLFASATTQSRLVRAKDISSVELVHAHLDRIALVNPGLNAVVQLIEERALREARAADAAIARGEFLGPLHGVPFTVKDWIDVAGVPCTGGELAHRDRIPTSDATVVARLRAAGGIVLGKTNVMIENDVYGRTDNPYRAGYSPAGSSSGEAAIIAAGGSPLGLGSDSGGSIRQPAHNCGIAGLKPTTRRLPITGHFPVIVPMNDPRTTIGPMARYVEDLAMALPILMGPDWQDASVVPVPLGDWNEVELRALRVAFYTHHAEAEPTAQTAAATRAAAKALEDVVESIEEALPERIEEAYDITRTYWKRTESHELDTWAPNGQSSFSGDDVARHLFEWDRFSRALLRFMARFDIVLTPAAEKPAQLHGEDQGRIPYTLPYSLSGYPAVVVRAGTSPDGLPIGVQVVARPWRDDVALAVARYLERALGGYHPPE